jgi:hypothetical protein
MESYFSPSSVGKTRRKGSAKLLLASLLRRSQGADIDPRQSIVQHERRRAKFAGPIK